MDEILDFTNTFLRLLTKLEKLLAGMFGSSKFK